MTDLRSSTRLACCLAASLLVHGGALLLPGQPTPAQPEVVSQRLSLYLQPAERQPAASAAPEQAGETARRPVIATSRPALSPTTADEHPPMISVAPSPSISGQARLEQAKTLLAAESRQRMLDPMFAPPAQSAGALSPLARATARPVPGEKMLGDGVLQITAADGKVHCLQRPPEVASRDIPGGSFAIPVTCPF